jgi:hypothetical protein
MPKYMKYRSQPKNIIIQYTIYLRFLHTCTNERLMKCKLSET